MLRFLQEIFCISHLGFKNDEHWEDCIVFSLLKRKLSSQSSFATQKELKTICSEKACKLSFACSMSWGKGSKKWICKWGLYFNAQSEKYPIWPQISNSVLHDER